GGNQCDRAHGRGSGRSAPKRQPGRARRRYDRELLESIERIGNRGILWSSAAVDLIEHAGVSVPQVPSQLVDAQGGGAPLTTFARRLGLEGERRAAGGASGVVEPLEQVTQDFVAFTLLMPRQRT